MRATLGLSDEQLHQLWDCDFPLSDAGTAGAAGPERYVLCEINVSCVTPNPDPVIAWLVQATLVWLEAGEGFGA